jgi:hypothetical protein
MPALNNTRHELFAQELAQGSSKATAYRRAGYAPDRHHACRLATKGHVAQRVAELQQSAAVDTQITLASLVARADELRRLAIEQRQLGAAVAALREIGTLVGLRIDRREVGSPGEFEHLTDEKLAAWIALETTKLAQSGPPD